MAKANQSTAQDVYNSRKTLQVELEKQIKDEQIVLRRNDKVIIHKMCWRIWSGTLRANLCITANTNGGTSIYCNWNVKQKEKETERYGWHRRLKMEHLKDKIQNFLTCQFLSMSTSTDQMFFACACVFGLWVCVCVCRALLWFYFRDQFVFSKNQ